MKMKLHMHIAICNHMLLIAAGLVSIYPLLLCGLFNLGLFFGQKSHKQNMGINSSSKLDTKIMGYIVSCHVTEQRSKQTKAMYVDEGWLWTMKSWLYDTGFGSCR